MLNTGQMLLVLGAFVLLSTVAVSMHVALAEHTDRSVDARLTRSAVGIGRARIEDLAFGAFDSLQAGSRADSLLTAAATFRCTTWIDYVEATAPDSAVTGPTPLKRVAVSVSADGMSAPVRLRAVAGSY